MFDPFLVFVLSDISRLLEVVDSFVFTHMAGIALVRVKGTVQSRV